MKIRVKMCGITRLQDALDAVEAGADAIGLVFYAPSPRAVDIEQAAEIVYALPPFVTSVGLFVDAEPEQVHEVLAQVPLSCLQFHGEESAAYCESFDRPYIKALRMKPGIDVVAEAGAFMSASGILLDTYHPGLPGGTGATFDWMQIPIGLPRPLILAGGLNPDNVAEAVRVVRPYAVDVSGGIEKGKGIKDAGKMAAFVRGVNSV